MTPQQAEAYQSLTKAKTLSSSSSNQQIHLCADNHQTHVVAVKSTPLCPFNLPICHVASEVGSAICSFDSQSTQDHLCSTDSQVYNSCLLLKRQVFQISPNYQKQKNQNMSFYRVSKFTKVQTSPHVKKHNRDKLLH